MTKHEASIRTLTGFSPFAYETWPAQFELKAISSAGYTLLRALVANALNTRPVNPASLAMPHETPA